MEFIVHKFIRSNFRIRPLQLTQDDKSTIKRNKQKIALLKSQYIFRQQRQHQKEEEFSFLPLMRIFTIAQNKNIQV
jgi:hypothetical protein